VYSGGAMAQVCSNCGSGSHKDDCIKCGKAIYSGAVMAQLCRDCGSGSKGQQCVKCGRS
jgi:hypothetical protein